MDYHQPAVKQKGGNCTRVDRPSHRHPGAHEDAPRTAAIAAGAYETACQSRSSKCNDRRRLGSISIARNGWNGRKVCLGIYLQKSRKCMKLISQMQQLMSPWGSTTPDRKPYEGYQVPALIDASFLRSSAARAAHRGQRPLPHLLQRAMACWIRVARLCLFDDASLGGFWVRLDTESNKQGGQLQSHVRLSELCRYPCLI